MKNSQCPSAPRGGDLDFIARKWMVEEPFAKAAFAMKVGDLSDIVTTDFGLHLILVTDRKPGTATTFEQVADEVRECVLEELRQTTLLDCGGRRRLRSSCRDGGGSVGRSTATNGPADKHGGGAQCERRRLRNAVIAGRSPGLVGEDQQRNHEWRRRDLSRHQVIQSLSFD